MDPISPIWGEAGKTALYRVSFVARYLLTCSTVHTVYTYMDVHAEIYFYFYENSQDGVPTEQFLGNNDPLKVTISFYSFMI